MAKTTNEDRQAFLITARGAQHRGKREGKWRVWGEGDTIDLTFAQSQSGNYAHLGLRPLIGTSAKKSIAAAPLARPSRTKPVTGDGVSDGERDRPTIQEIAAPGDDELEEIEPDENAAERHSEGEKTSTDEPDGDETTGDDQPSISKRKLNSLIDAVEEASSAAEVKVARDKVIKADAFDEDSLPTRKADLLQALISYRDEQFPAAE